MAKYQITSPKGTKFEITAPDDATEEQVLSYAQAQFAEQDTKKEETPGLFGAMWEGAKEGALGFHDISQTVDALSGGRPEMPTSKYPELAAPLSFEPGMPNFPKLGYKLAKGASETVPEAAGFVAGSAVAGGPQTGVGLLTGALGAAAVNTVKSIGPYFAQELQKNPNDPDKAFNSAMESAIGSGAVTGASFASFALAPFTGAVKNLLFQSFGVQPAVGAAGAALQGADASGVGEAAVLGSLGTVIPAAAHGLAKKLVPGKKPADTTTPGTTEQTPGLEVPLKVEKPDDARSYLLEQGWEVPETMRLSDDQAVVAANKYLAKVGKDIERAQYETTLRDEISSELEARVNDAIESGKDLNPKQRAKIENSLYKEFAEREGVSPAYLRTLNPEPAHPELTSALGVEKGPAGATLLAGSPSEPALNTTTGINAIRIAEQMRAIGRNLKGIQDVQRHYSAMSPEGLRGVVTHLAPEMYGPADVLSLEKVRSKLDADQVPNSDIFAKGILATLREKGILTPEGTFVEDVSVPKTSTAEVLRAAQEAVTPRERTSAEQTVRAAQEALGKQTTPDRILSDVPQGVVEHLQAVGPGEKISVPVVQNVYGEHGKKPTLNYVKQDLDRLTEAGVLEKRGDNWYRSQLARSGPNFEVGTRERPLVEGGLGGDLTSNVSREWADRRKNDVETIVRNLLGPEHSERVRVVPDVPDIIQQEFRQRGLGSVSGVVTRDPTLGDIAYVAYMREGAPGKAIHESWHLAERIGLVRPGEMKLLDDNAVRLREVVDRARAEGAPFLEGVPDHYLNQPHELRAYAMESDGYLQARGLGSPLPTGIARVFETIRKFYDKVLDKLHLDGLRRYEDVRDAYFRGDMGKRKATNVLTGETAPAYGGLGNKMATQVSETLDYLRTPKELKTGSEVSMVGRLFSSMYNLGTRNTDAAPVVKQGIEMNSMSQKLRADQSHALEPYGKLSGADKRKAEAAMIILRAKGKRWDGRPIVNDTAHDLAQAPKGSVLELTPAQAEGVRAVEAWNDLNLKTMKNILDNRAAEFGVKHPSAATLRDAARNADNKRDRDQLNAMASDYDTMRQFGRSLYVPLNRFGNYGVAVHESVRDAMGRPVLDKDGTPKKGKLLHFATYNVKGAGRGLEAKKAMAQIAELKAKYPNATVSDKPFKLSYDSVFNNVDKNFLSTLDGLTTLLPMENQKAMKPLTDLAKKYADSHKPSWLRRAEMVPGFEQNLERAINEHIYRFASWAAKEEHLPRMKSLAEKAKDRDTYNKVLQPYIEYLESPDSEYQALKQIGFMWFLTDPSAAAMNLTQALPAMVFTTMWSNPAAAANAMGYGLRQAASALSFDKGLGRKVKDQYIDIAKLKHLEKDMPFLSLRMSDGILKPLQTAEAVNVMGYGDTMAGRAETGFQKLTQIMGSAFATTETLNRVATYIGVHKSLEKPGRLEKAIKTLSAKNELFKLDLEALGKEATPAQLKDLVAKYGVNETQFIYGKETRPMFQRGLGSVAFQFQNYPINMLELMGRMMNMYGPMGKVAMGTMLMGLMGLSGMWGIPFAENTKDITEAIYKYATKEKINLDAEARRLTNELFGDPHLSEVLWRGLGRTAGLDISRRAGMGDIPLLSQAYALLGEGQAGDVLAAPAIQVLKSPIESLHLAREGRSTAAVLSPMLPKPAKNFADAFAWREEGVRTQSDLPVVPPENVSIMDAIIKASGFTPTDVARSREGRRAAMEEKDPVLDLRKSIYRKLSRADADLMMAMSSGDQGAITSAQRRVQDIINSVGEHNASAKEPNRLLKIDASERRKNLMEELLGVEATIPQMRRAARGQALESASQYPKGK